jgi:hypothetical protein
VHDLRVELHPETVAAVAHRCQREPLGLRDPVETGRQLFDGVAVAHPRALVVGEALEQATGLGDVDRSRSVFALALGRDLATQDVRHEVHAVADAEDREPAVQDRGLDERRVLVVHARRSAGEDDADHAASLELLGGDVVGEDLAVHAGLADAARDELRVLGSIVEDRDRCTMLLGGLPLRRLEAAVRRAHLLIIAQRLTARQPRKKLGRPSRDVTGCTDPDGNAFSALS